MADILGSIKVGLVPDSREDLRCPKCQHVCYNKISFRNHINVCKKVSSEETVVVDKPQRIVVDGFIKLSEAEKRNFKIFEKAIPVREEVFLAPVSKQDKLGSAYAKKAYTCLQCDESLTGFRPFSYHLYLHLCTLVDETELPQLCVGCGCEFESRAPRLRHGQESVADTKCAQSVNDIKIIRKCQLCMLRFPSKVTLKHHLKQHAIEAKPFEDLPCFNCPHCPEIYGHESLMELHKLSHGLPDEPKKARKRGRPKKTKEEHLMSSKEATRGQKRPMSSPAKEMKKVHKTSTNQKFINHRFKSHHKFMCLMCPQAFNSKNQLEKHTEMHDAEVAANAKGPAVCNPCNRRFDNHKDLHKHLQQGHKMTKEDNKARARTQEEDKAWALEPEDQVGSGNNEDTLAECDPLCDSEDEEVIVASEVIGEGRIDNECDRVFDDPLVGRCLKVLYEGWHQGKILYYNKKLAEYVLEFPDGSYDYVKSTDIDGTDIILLDE